MILESRPAAGRAVRAVVWAVLPALRGPKRLALAAVLLAGVAAVVAGALAADWWFCLPEGEVAQYVGRQACAACHPRETELWTSSDHARAMGPATADTVLGDFEDRKLEHFGVTSRMFRRGDGYFVTTDNREGRMKTFQVKYVLGYRPLQQYLVQCLPVAYDTVGRRWFHLYPDEPIPHQDPLHWTRPLQNWNYMCAECHTTNLQRNYRVEDNTYHTTFSEMDVSCETCHGPGSLHVRIAESKRIFWDRRYGYGLPRLKDPDPRVEIDSCSPCHARRRIVYSGYRGGERLMDYYLPELLDTDLYWPDGQIRDEVYEYSSFVQSKMHARKVRCSNCHDPHTGRVKFLDDQNLPDNRLCGQCHVAAKYDTPQHHHHPDSSKPGFRCVECHMPETTYMVVDPRRDHSLRVPRPDLSIALGIPNACSGCHHDASKGETPQWCEDRVREWYGPLKGPPHFAYAFDAARKGKPEARQMLLALLRREDLRPIVRATGIALLAGRLSPAAQNEAFQGLESPEELVRIGALRAVEELPAETLFEQVKPLLRDPVRAVRVEAARIVSRVPSHRFAPADQKAFEAALAEYLTGQESLGDQPDAHLTRGIVYTNLGRLDEAEKAYRTALHVDGEFFPARINLGMLYDQQRKPAEAEAEFRKAIAELERQVVVSEKLAKHAPAGAVASERPADRIVEELRRQLAEAHYSLGLLLGADDVRLPEATKALAAAAKLAPADARIHYNLGVAFQRSGRPAEAEQALLTACQLAPLGPDYVRALCILYTQQRQWDRALAAAEQLVLITSGDPQSHALLDLVRRQAAASEPKR
jgi:predicted CXXCH cytochrome family protein